MSKSARTGRFGSIISVVLLIFGTGCTDTMLRMMGNRLEENMTFDLPASLPDGLHVLVCGAGGPLPDVKRSSACMIVIAGDTVMLFDAGAGSARNMALAGLPPSRVERVFLTHFHSDHIDGLGEVATLRWAAGDWPEPLPVHGPEGVAEIASGLNLAYRRDQTYRTEHHGVEYKDRSIAISGDTSKSDNLIAQSRGVDVLFHEALSRTLVGVMNQSAQNVGNAILAKITADILDYHASPVEAAESARQADARALVIYHVVPPLPVAPLERIFRQGMSDAYDGPIEIAVDGTFVSLPAGSREIEIEAP